MAAITGGAASAATTPPRNFEHADLQGRDLHGRDFRGANFLGANLRGANLSGAHLERATFQEANLQRANLTGAHLARANFFYANLYRAKLTGAQLQNANLVSANLDRVSLASAGLVNANFESAHLYAADLCGARLPGAVFANAVLAYARVDRAILLLNDVFGANTNGLRSCAPPKPYAVRVPPMPVPTPRTVQIARTPPTPLPVAVSTPTPFPLPTVAPLPMPKPVRYFAFNALTAARVHNELSPGNRGSRYSLRFAFELGSRKHPFLLRADVDHYAYQHVAEHVAMPCNPAIVPFCRTVIGNGQYYTGVCPTGEEGCVTVIGEQLLQPFTGFGQAYVNTFDARETIAQVQAGIKIANPRVYAMLGWYHKNYNYLGYPNLDGPGFGITKLADPAARFSYYADLSFYPSVRGEYTFPASQYLGPFSARRIPFGYSVIKTSEGATVRLTGSLFVEAGYEWELDRAGPNAPISLNLYSPFLGIGVKY